jgi:L-ascorbate metabolism protein UlaG (beta-lactamase superfamily)
LNARLGTLLLAVSCSCGPVPRLASRAAGAMFGPMREVPNKITHPVRSDARLAALWIGHATVLVQIDDKFVLTDPILTSAAGQMSKRLVEPGISPGDLPPLDAVVISHLHFDHLSLGSLDLIEPKVKELLLPRGALVYVPNYAFDAREIATWESWESGGLRIVAVPVEHNGWRYGADQAWMKTAFTGWIVQYHGLTVYFGGDTAYAEEKFAATARAFPSIDLALMPIAPIHPRDFMRISHVDPDEAVRAFLDLRAKRMIPIHYGTFIDSMDEPGEALALLGKATREHGVADRVDVLAIGEQRVIVPR